MSFTQIGTPLAVTHKNDSYFYNDSLKKCHIVEINNKINKVIEKNIALALMKSCLSRWITRVFNLGRTDERTDRRTTSEAAA